MLKAHFINCGQGDTTLLVLPNGEIMLIDVNLTDEVLDYLKEIIPEDSNGNRTINYLVITHPHNDHIRGIKSLTENFTVKEIWESGHRFTVPKDQQEQYQDYIDMRDIINAMKKASSLSVRVPVAKRAVYKSIGGVDFYIFSPSKSLVETDNPSENDIHEQCMVMKVVYAGNSVLFTGDSNRKSWQDRVVKYYSDNGVKGQENLLDSKILHASHHGSYTFFMDEDTEDKDKHYYESLEKIDPDITIISVGDGNAFGHPSRRAVNYYKQYTYKESAEQVYRTDKLGTTVVEFLADGSFRLMPLYHYELFKNGCKLTSEDVSVNISVYADKPLDSYGRYPKKTSLTFNANIEKPPEKLIRKIKWEVQNNGIGADKRVHDWYLGQENDAIKYDNYTAYHGAHNLLCKVYIFGKQQPVACHLIQVKVAPQ